MERTALQRVLYTRMTNRTFARSCSWHWGCCRVSPLIRRTVANKRLKWRASCGGPGRAGCHDARIWMDPARCGALREDPLLKGIPVIFMTAKAMPQEVSRFRAMGAAGVIAKPFDPMMQLGKQVMALWGKYSGRAYAWMTAAAPRAVRHQVSELGEKFLRRTRSKLLLYACCSVVFRMAIRSTAGAGEYGAQDPRQRRRVWFPGGERIRRRNRTSGRAPRDS